MNRSTRNVVSKSFAGRRRWLVLLSLIALFCGCLRADVFHYLGYDAADDSFTASVVYTNIQSESPADLEHLAKLWKQREQIIIHPFVLNFFGGQLAVLRIDARQYKSIDLARAASQEQPVQTSEIPLDSIVVKPGRFFFGPDKTLCYAHQIKVPGKFIDQLLTLANKFTNAGLTEEIPKELKRRAEGGKVGTWDELRREIAKEIAAESNGNKSNGADNARPADAAKPQPPPPPKAGEKEKGFPLSTASLERLQQAAAKGELAIERRGGEFSVALPLTPDDCREAKATIDTLTDAIKKHLAAQGKPADDIADLYKSIQAENDAGKRLVIKFAVPRFASLNPETSFPAAKPDPKLAARYQSVIEFVRSHEIPIDEKLTLKEVVEGLAAEHK